MAMTLSSPLTFVFFVLVLQETILFSVMADMNFIESICKSTPSYDLCMKTVTTDPGSQNADLTGLALIEVNAVKAKGIDTINFIKDLENNRPELSSSLRYCVGAYDTVVNTDVPLAINALTQGNPKFGEDGIADVAVESQACERTFGQNDQASPMTSVNQDMEDLANVARAMIRMLL